MCNTRCSKAITRPGDYLVDWQSLEAGTEVDWWGVQVGIDEAYKNWDTGNLKIDQIAAEIEKLVLENVHLPIVLKTFNGIKIRSKVLINVESLWESLTKKTRSNLIFGNDRRVWPKVEKRLIERKTELVQNLSLKLLTNPRSTKIKFPNQPKELLTLENPSSRLSNQKPKRKVQLRRNPLWDI